MAYTMEDVLADPLVSAASPRVATAAERVSITVVRWAHASEQLDVAPLLQGGEVLLMEGVHLGGGQGPTTLEAYVDSLVSAGVAALVVELGDRLPRVPAPVLRRAEERGLVVVELGRRVPFVQICQSVNLRLAERTFRQIQQGDNLSSALTLAAATGADVGALLDDLARVTGSRVSLLRLDGREVHVAGERTDETRASFAVPIEAAGSPLGTLALATRVSSDLDAVAAALDRAPRILALTLFRSVPPDRRELVTGRLLAHLARAGTAGPGEDADLDVLLRDLGLRAGPEPSYLSIRIDVGAHTDVVAPVRDALAAATPHHVVQLRDGVLVAVAGFPGRDELAAARPRLRHDLDAVLPDGVVGCLGVGATGERRLAGEHQTVTGYRAWAPHGARGLWDARDFQLRRLTRALDADEAVTDFRDEVLGRLVDAPELVRTLRTYASVWGSKTAAAHELGIGRQALYDRLARIEEVLGPLDATRARSAAVIVAALLTTPDAPTDPTTRRVTAPR